MVSWDLRRGLCRDDSHTCSALHSLLQAASRSAGVVMLVVFVLVLAGELPVPPMSRDHWSCLSVRSSPNGLTSYITYQVH